MKLQKLQNTQIQIKEKEIRLQENFMLLDYTSNSLIESYVWLHHLHIDKDRDEK